MAHQGAAWLRRVRRGSVVCGVAQKGAAWLSEGAAWLSLSHKFDERFFSPSYRVAIFKRTRTYGFAAADLLVFAREQRVCH